MATSEAQKKAVRKYAAKMKRIPLDVSLVEYARIQVAAENAGESINGYIKRAINQRMRLENEEAIKAVQEWLTKNSDDSNSDGYKAAKDILAEIINPIEVNEKNITKDDGTQQLA